MLLASLVEAFQEDARRLDDDLHVSILDFIEQVEVADDLLLVCASRPARSCRHGRAKESQVVLGFRFGRGFTTRLPYA